MCNDHSQHLSRRSLIAAGATTVVMGGLADVYAQTSPNADPSAAVSPDEALKRLADGNTRYSSNTSINRDMSAGRAGRAQAQYPFAALVSCSDSRVAPELAFDQGPGDLFVVRVAGNFVNTDGLASLEYGVKIFWNSAYCRARPFQLRRRRRDDQSAKGKDETAGPPSATRECDQAFYRFGREAKGSGPARGGDRTECPLQCRALAVGLNRSSPRPSPRKK